MTLLLIKDSRSKGAGGDCATCMLSGGTCPVFRWTVLGWSSDAGCSNCTNFNKGFIKAEIYRYCAEEPVPTRLARYQRDKKRRRTRTKRKTDKLQNKQNTK